MTNNIAPLSRHRRERLLDQYFGQVQAVILNRQHPVSGLLPASTASNAHGDYTHAWVRDNVYSILAAWGLALAYRKVEKEEGRTYLLEQSVVKLMRGLLISMMKQADKVEAFKQDQNPLNALHAKYDTVTGNAVVNDHDWGHLQLDATSLYLLMLAQMTSSGLRIIFTLDEVAFIQNLVHYIGRAYRTPDYGIWERGNKINHGITELNASSVGMAKSALEAIRGLNLFGTEGGIASVVHVVSDEIARARSTLASLLPRESGSKECDAAILSIIGFPGFAVEDTALVKRTNDNVISKLEGLYGCKRFLLDGHQTVLEDTNRLHYEANELRHFSNIESEWPLFFTYFVLNAQFSGDAETATKYIDKLSELTVLRDGNALLPELYYVTSENIDKERHQPHSQKRLPNENIPLVWAQSLYYLGLMINDNLIDINDIDPLGLHYKIGNERSLTVQLAIVSETESVQRKLIEHGIVSQTLEQVRPIQIRPSSELAEALFYLGKCDKLSLTGRPPRRIRSLTTSQVFRLRDETIIFIPEFINQSDFYINYDNKLLVEQLKNELLYHKLHWTQPGKPLLVILITESMMHKEGQQALIDLMEELQLGECNGIPVKVGRLNELVPSTVRRRMDYLGDYHFKTPPRRASRIPQFCLKWDKIKTRPVPTYQERIIDQESSYDELVTRLEYSDNPYLQIKILSRLVKLVGLSFVTCIQSQERSMTVVELIDELYYHSAINQVWSVVRQAAALLKRSDPSLEDAVTELVARQKQVAVGRSYNPDALIRVPLPNSEILRRIDYLTGNDDREKVLTQEVLVLLGTLIKANPSLFSGILTLRIGHLIALITNQISNDYHIPQDESFEILLQLRPSDIQAKLHSVLSAFKDHSLDLSRAESLHSEGADAKVVPVIFSKTIDPKNYGGYPNWRAWREHSGVLSRVPDSFFAHIWDLLSHCQGLVIGDRFDRLNRLDSSLQSEMTANEKNFALHVEHVLNKIQAPEYRYLTIEALSALHSIFDENPSFHIKDHIVIDAMIGHAVRLSWLSLNKSHERTYDHHRSDAWNAFYNLSPHEVAEAILKALLYLLQAGGSTDAVTDAVAAGARS
ncbi:MAG: glycoside hydrolase family 15 protein [Gammaproteobacteria bacterium]|nr:glycoside hydrolase family 15 protein [Gammaproteobacteria bacterium]